MKYLPPQKFKSQTTKYCRNENAKDSQADSCFRNPAVTFSDKYLNVQEVDKKVRKKGLHNFGQ